MPTLENSVAVEKIMQILIKIVGRRTTKEFAVNSIESIVDRLQNKYDFLKYIEVENAAYSEKKGDVIINSEIDSIDITDISDAIDDIFNEMIKTMGKNVGYYYIKEIQEDLEREIGSFFNEYDVNLNIKQQEHLLEIMETSVVKIQEIKNSEIFNIILTGIVKLLNRKISESFTKEAVMDSIKQLEEQYDFLRYLNIEEIRDPRSPYQVKIDPDIDNILIAERGEVVQRLIEEIGRASDLDTRRFLGEKFEMLLDNRDLAKIKKIGVELEQIDKVLRKEGHQLIITEVFQVILGVVEKKITVDFGVKYIDAMITKMKDKHDVLKYITVDKSRLDEGIHAIEINPEINNVDSYELGKAIKDILVRSQIDLKELTSSFFADFEKSFNKKYILEIEKMGVNLHILELRSVR
jgi:hypothetical protein